MLAGWAITDPQAVAAMAVRPSMLNGLAVALVITAVAWVGVVVATHLALRSNPNRTQRTDRRRARRRPRLCRGRTDGGRRSLQLRPGQPGQLRVQEREGHEVGHPAERLDADRATEAGTAAAVDPWAKKPRLNLLLLGGDAGKGRTGTRTDTVIVASIDTKTGDTTLVSLPRNTGRMPFPADSPLHKYYPNGFTDGDGNNAEYFLNAMYDNVPARSRRTCWARPTTSAPT